MFQTFFLSIIRRINTLFTAIVIGHISYVDSLLARRELTVNITSTYIYIYIYTHTHIFTAIGLLPGGSGYFTCKQYMILVTTKFKSGGLHEKHVVATWNLGIHLSICL